MIPMEVNVTEEKGSVAEELEATAEVVAKVRGRSFQDIHETKINFEPVVGVWENCDARTRGIVRIELAEQAGNLVVHVFGACVPTACDWGAIQGTAYAESVVDNDAVAFTAPYDPGFADKLVTGHLDGGTLIVEVFTNFKDGSGRSNYYAREYLCRQSR
jgi:hypothetical protein